MRIEQSVIDRLRESKDEDVKKLVEFWEFIHENEAYESYVTRMIYIRSWNSELDEKKVKLINTDIAPKKGEDGKIILETHDKAVDRTMKFFDGQVKYLEDTQKIRAMLLKTDVDKLNNDKRLKNSEDLAFKPAMLTKDGRY